MFVLATSYNQNPSATSVWNEVKAGALRAAGPLGLTVDVRAPTINGSAITSSFSCDTVRQVAALIRRAAEEKPLGLVVTASDTAKCVMQHARVRACVPARHPHSTAAGLAPMLCSSCCCCCCRCGRAIIPAMQAARAAGVPVIAIDQNGKAAVEEGGALHFVGGDGAAAGRQLCGQLKADGARALLFVDFDGGAAQSVNERLDGCEAVMGGTRTRCAVLRRSSGGSAAPEAARAACSRR